MKFRKKPVVIEAWQFNGDLSGAPSWVEMDWFAGESLHITTLEGTMRADVGDWIIKGIKGELYPCKPDIFEATYDAVDKCPNLDCKDGYINLCGDDVQVCPTCNGEKP
jgi:hypothetical protein